MPTNLFFISEASLRNLKSLALRRVDGVSSSHLSEAIAAALGFKTNASLRTALAGHRTAEVPKPSNARLVRRLRQLGYANIPRDLQLLPELDRSYSPFRTYPLRRKRGVRWTAWRNVVVAAVNAGLEQRLFGLAPDEDWWPGADPQGNGGQHVKYAFLFDGAIPTIVGVHAIGGDELSIHVMLNPSSPNINPEHPDGLKDCDAFAHCWLERRLGAWIQDGGERFGSKHKLLQQLMQAKVDPRGFSDQGSFIV